MTRIYCIGVMTGTSCDGADVALLEFRRDRLGRWSERLAKTGMKAFPSSLRRKLRDAQKGRTDIRSTALLARDYSSWIAALCDRKLRQWRLPRASCIIAIHGQTVWHEPESRISVQLFDPSIVVARTRCTVTANFRQPDLAHGGQGAPLVPYYHWLRGSSTFKQLLPFAIHNVGGIANLTYITRDRQEVIAFDTGPGNSLIDLATERFTSGRQKYDRGGKIGSSAREQIDWREIHRLARHGYFTKRPPKSTGRELFNEAFLNKLPGSGASLVANATALSAHTMAKSYADFVLRKGAKLNAVFVAGGGARNPFLLKLFRAELVRLSGREIEVRPLPTVLAPPQYLEAMAFARLGFEAIQGNPVSLSAVTGARGEAVGAGIFPGDNFRKILKLMKLA